jgi:regulator of replication initiation timing
MSSEATLSEIYREVKEVRRMLEEIIEKNILATLSTEELGEEERLEVNRRIKDMKRGDYVELEATR